LNSVGSLGVVGKGVLQILGARRARQKRKKGHLHCDMCASFGRLLKRTEKARTEIDVSKLALLLTMERFNQKAQEKGLLSKKNKKWSQGGAQGYPEKKRGGGSKEIKIFRE